MLRLEAERAGIDPSAIEAELEEVGYVVEALTRKPKPLRGYGLFHQVGSGKTWIAVAAMQELDAKSAMILVPNKDLARTWRTVAGAFGVKVRPGIGPGWRVNTYAFMRQEARLAEFRAKSGKVDFFVADESQALKNEDSLQAKVGRSFQALGENQLYLSATPFQSSIEMQYLETLGLWEGIGSWNWLVTHGARLDPRSGELVATGDVRALLKARKEMLEKGAMSERGIPPTRKPAEGELKAGAKIVFPTENEFLRGRIRWTNPEKTEVEPLMSISPSGADLWGEPVMIDTKRVSIPIEFHYRLERAQMSGTAMRLVAAVEEAFTKEIAGANPRNKMFLSAMRVLATRRALEVGKAEAALRIATNAREKGFSVAVLTEYKTEIEGSEAVRRRLHHPEILDELFAELARMETSSISKIVKALGGPGVVAQVHGDVSNTQAMQDADEFQANRKKILVATLAKAGAGLSFHDTEGKHPRYFVATTLPWTGMMTEQAIGRGHRLGSKSESHFTFLFDPNTPLESVLSRRVGKKLQFMKALVAGVSDDRTARDLLRFDISNPSEMQRELDQEARGQRPAEGYRAGFTTSDVLHGVFWTGGRVWDFLGKVADEFRGKGEIDAEVGTLLDRIEEAKRKHAVRREGFSWGKLPTEEHPSTTLFAFPGMLGLVPSVVRKMVRAIPVFGAETSARMRAYADAGPLRRLKGLAIWHELFSERDALFGRKFTRMLAAAGIGFQLRLARQRAKILGPTYGMRAAEVFRFLRQKARGQPFRPRAGILAQVARRDPLRPWRFKDPTLQTLVAAHLDRDPKMSVEQALRDADPRYLDEIRKGLTAAELAQPVEQVLAARYPEHVETVRRAREWFDRYRRRLFKHYRRSRWGHIENELKYAERQLARAAKARHTKNWQRWSKVRAAAEQAAEAFWREADQWGFKDYLTHIWGGDGSIAGAYDRMSVLLRMIRPRERFNRFVQHREGKTGYILDLDEILNVYTPETERAIAYGVTMDKVRDYFLGKWRKPYSFRELDTVQNRTVDPETGLLRGGLLYILEPGKSWVKDPTGHVVGVRVRQANDKTGQTTEVWRRRELREAWHRVGGIVDDMWGRERFQEAMSLTEQELKGRGQTQTERVVDRVLIGPFGTWLRQAMLQHPRSGMTNVLLGWTSLFGEVGIQPSLEGYSRALVGMADLLPRGKQRAWRRHAARSGALIWSRGWDPTSYGRPGTLLSRMGKTFAPTVAGAAIGAAYGRPLLGAAIGAFGFKFFRWGEALNRVATEYAAGLTPGAPPLGSEAHRELATFLNGQVNFHFTLATMPGVFTTKFGRLLLFLENTQFRIATQTLRRIRESVNFGLELARKGTKNANLYAARALVRGLFAIVATEEVLRHTGMLDRMGAIGRLLPEWSKTPSTIGYQVGTRPAELPGVSLMPSFQERLASLPWWVRLWRIPIPDADSLPLTLITQLTDAGIAKYLEGNEAKWDDFWANNMGAFGGRYVVDVMRQMDAERTPDGEFLFQFPHGVRTLPEAEAKRRHPPLPGLPVAGEERRAAVLRMIASQAATNRELEAGREEIKHGAAQAAPPAYAKHGVQIQPADVAQMLGARNLTGALKRIQAASPRAERWREAAIYWPHATMYERGILKGWAERWYMQGVESPAEAAAAMHFMDIVSERR